MVIRKNNKNKLYGPTAIDYSKWIIYKYEEMSYTYQLIKNPNKQEIYLFLV